VASCALLSTTWATWRSRPRTVGSICWHIDNVVFALRNVAAMSCCVTRLIPLAKGSELIPSTTMSATDAGLIVGIHQLDKAEPCKFRNTRSEYRSVPDWRVANLLQIWGVSGPSIILRTDGSWLNSDACVGQLGKIATDPIQ
jgi:hypothetical protein